MYEYILVTAYRGLGVTLLPHAAELSASAYGIDPDDLNNVALVLTKLGSQGFRVVAVVPGTPGYTQWTLERQRAGAGDEFLRNILP